MATKCETCGDWHSDAVDHCNTKAMKADRAAVRALVEALPFVKRVDGVWYVINQLADEIGIREETLAVLRRMESW